MTRQRDVICQAAVEPAKSAAVGRARGIRRVFGRIIAGICVATALFAVGTFLWQIGSRIGEVRSGERTMAELWRETGRWLLGMGGISAENEAEKSPAKEDPAPTEGTEESEARDLYAFDASCVPAGQRAIRPVDLWETHGNKTTEGNFPTLVGDGQTPVVLILHAHAGEGYTPAGTVGIPENESVGRGEGRETSVVGIGAYLSDVLTAAGVSVVHCEIPFDSGGNAGAFDRAEAAVTEMLALYPGVRYVIDLHREGGIDRDGNVLRALTEADGEVYAQIRLYAPAGDSTALAWAIDAAMNDGGRRVCRGVAEIPAGFSWEERGILSLRPEIGTAGNSQEEAERAARAFAEALLAVTK